MASLAQRSMSRAEVRDFIRSYQKRSGIRKGWYQNIRFGFCLETRRSVLDCLIEMIRRRPSKEDLVIQNLPQLQGKRVIDIGCNAGAYSVAASCRGAEYVLGVDKSPLRVEQAQRVAQILRRRGRPVGTVEFRVVDDIMRKLHYLDDMDVFIACCVLYHLGPLDPLETAIRKSSIRTLVLQGNMGRAETADDHGNSDFSNGRHSDPKLGRLADIEDLSTFCRKLGFSVVKSVGHDYPLVIAER